MSDNTYERITDELKQRGKDWTWLAARLGFTTGRTGNWKKRGVPASAHASIAAILGQTTDWVAGLSDKKQSGVTELSPMAQKLAEEFDSITDEKAQLDAFARCIAVITRATGGI